MILYDRVDESSYIKSKTFTKLNKEFLQYTDKIKFKPGLEGNKIDDNGIVFVGDRAGPSLNIEYLCHELSHFVEIDDQRMKMYGWGLKLPEQWIFGTRCIEPETMQATARELRVMAYQINLLRYLGEKISEYELVNSLKYMPDFSYVPLEDGVPLYVNGKRRLFRLMIEFEKADESRINWMVARVKELCKEYTLERFKAEWFRKIKIL